MRNDAGLDETLAVLIEIYAPGIAGAFPEDLENVFGGMIAPYAGIDTGALLVGRAGFADVRVREHTMAAVEPAIRTPGEGAERFVGVLVSPAVEQNPGRPGGLRLVPILNGNKHQIRRRPHPHAAETHFEAADQIQALHEHRPAIEFAVPI